MEECDKSFGQSYAQLNGIEVQKAISNETELGDMPIFSLHATAINALFLLQIPKSRTPVGWITIITMIEDSSADSNVIVLTS